MMGNASSASYFVFRVQFKKSDFQHIHSGTHLTPRSKRIADYWLSLGGAAERPARAQIDPNAIKDLLPGLIFFLVAPHMAVNVRMAGTSFSRRLGFDPSGRDWLSLTPARNRNERLRIFTAVADGAVAIAEWRLGSDDSEISCQKLLLPLRIEDNVPGIPVLGFVDWSPLRDAPFTKMDLSSTSPPHILTMGLQAGAS